jgi:hypothetical protein
MTIRTGNILGERYSIASEPQEPESKIEVRCEPRKRLKSLKLIRVDCKSDPIIHRRVEMPKKFMLRGQWWRLMRHN